MARTITLTILIVVGLAVGGYALWSNAQNAPDAAEPGVAGTTSVPCGAVAACSSEGGSCPSASTCGAATACVDENHTKTTPDARSSADAACAERHADGTCCCDGDIDDCVCDEDCAGDGTCGDDAAGCTEAMKASCGRQCATSQTEAS